MKRLVTLMFMLLLATGIIFAKDDYHGDIQIHFGVGFDSMETDAEKSYATLYDVDLDTWNLFDLNNMIFVGFLAGFNGGLGETTSVVLSDGSESKSDVVIAMHCNFLIGPAVGIDIFDIIRFNVGAGLAYEFALNENGLAGLGFGTDIQAKFIPNRKVSPVLGYRFQIVKGLFGDSKTSKYFNNKVYAGISFNW